MAHPHQAHREHIVAKQRVGHIARGYKTGGAVHGDEAEDERLIRREVKPSALKRAHGGKIDGKAAKHRLDRRAAGGRVKKKGQTNVNVIVTPHPGGPGGAPAGIGAASAPPAPMPVPPPRPPVAPPMAGPPGGMPPPGAGGPPMLRAKGGRVGSGNKLEPKTASALPKRARGGNVPGEELKKAYDTGRANSSTGAGRPKDGPAWKEGLRAGTQISHTAGNTAGASLAAHEGVKKIRTYRKGGGVNDVSMNEKPPFSKAVEAGFGSASANPFPRMTAGGKSGVGRLQKMHKSHGAKSAA